MKWFGLFWVFCLCGCCWATRTACDGNFSSRSVFFERVGAYDPTLSLADGELPAFQKEIERQLVDYHESKDKEQECMDRLESRKAIVATVSKIKRNV